MKKYLLALLPCLYIWLPLAEAEIVNLTATLDCSRADAGSGTCGAGGSGSGVGSMSFDTATSQLSWEISYTGLSSAVSAAHFHGPAAPNQNAGVQVEIGTSNPAFGSAILSATQASDLLAGRWYINIHSANFPAGEIRGQVEIGAECGIQLDAPAYVDGETVTANVFRLANPSGVKRAIELKVWLGAPGFAPIEVINAGADGSLVFPPGTDIDLGPLALLPISAGLPRGSYEFSCRMLDPVTGQLLAEDRNFFVVGMTQPPLPAPQAPGDLVITEVMVNPEASLDADGEWFEIYNPTATDFDLQGLVVSDDGSDAFTIDSSLPIPAGGFVVLGANADTAINGGVNLDYRYANFSLSNSGDEIVISNGATEIDRIGYIAGSFPLESGSASSLDPGAFDWILNDDGINWCPAPDLLPQGDRGSPGAANPDCL